MNTYCFLCVFKSFLGEEFPAKVWVRSMHMSGAIKKLFQEYTNLVGIKKIMEE